MGKRLRCEKLIDDDQIPFGNIVGVRKRAPREQRRFQGLEVPGQNHLVVGGPEPAGIAERLLSAPTDRKELIGQWKGCRSGDLLNAGNRTERIANFAKEGAPLLRCGLLRIERLKGEKAASIKAWID